MTWGLTQQSSIKMPLLTWHLLYMLPLCSLEEVGRMLVTNCIRIIRKITYPDLFNNLCNRKICFWWLNDTIWNNKRNTKKCWPRALKRKKWDTVHRDHTNITATCWKDKRLKYITLICRWAEFLVRIMDTSEAQSSKNYNTCKLIQGTGWTRGLM